MELSNWLHIFEILAISVAAFLAWRIGVKQNKINKKAVDIANFVEIFVMPQQVLIKDENKGQQSFYWNLIIKNASSYPIYLNSFRLNGILHSLGSVVVPIGGDNWYGIPIPKDIQDKKELSLEVKFEDYLGKKYYSKNFGEYKNYSWQIKSNKSEQLYEKKEHKKQ